MIHVHVAKVFEVHFVVTLYGTCTYMYMYTCTIVNATKSVQHLLYSHCIHYMYIHVHVYMQPGVL